MDKSLPLDTCGLLWLASGSHSFSRAAKAAIAAAPFVYVSPITAWGISLEVNKGRLVLPKPVREWFAFAMQVYKLQYYPLSAEVLFLANELPWHHHDSADRFILATAKISRFVVVTGGKRFPEYGVETIC
jgi:PIN domain nuclease of toxin-antitoxin system